MYTQYYVVWLATRDGLALVYDGSSVNAYVFVVRPYVCAVSPLLLVVLQNGVNGITAVQQKHKALCVREILRQQFSREYRVRTAFW